MGGVTQRAPRDLTGTIRKQVATKFVPGATDRTFVFVASDGSVDRMNDTIDPNGWDLTRYRSNPVIQWAHDTRQLPIGQSLREWTENGQLKSEIRFTSQDENPDGFRVMKLIEGGFLRAVSVGFHPIESKDAADRATEDSWFMPQDFTKQELLEISVVPVPANPNALLAARAAGHDTTFILRWAERTLAECKGEGLWVPRAQIEGVVGALHEPKVIVDLGAKAPEPGPSTESTKAAPKPPEPAPEKAPLTAADLRAAFSSQRMRATGQLT